jgi:hypothetical protein
MVKYNGIETYIEVYDRYIDNILMLEDVYLVD